ncbi:MAG TPA: hypothetical protein VG650_00005 [Mycobacteriales bacterium]|nr:hypothetical protein [Mycobacteriales bacterium]
MPIIPNPAVSPRLAPALVVCALLCAGCASPSGPAPRALPRGDATTLVNTPPRAAAPPATPSAGHPRALLAVAHVVRRWFGRYRDRYSEAVRIETLVPHIDSPTWADVFVVARFADRPLDAGSHASLDRPKPGRYYRSVQLRLRGGRWHIVAVRPT